MEKEILSDIRNKLQPFSLVLERMAEGLTVSESFLKLAIRDLNEAWRLFQNLPTEGKSNCEFIMLRKL